MEQNLRIYPFISSFWKLLSPPRISQERIPPPNLLIL